MTPRPPDATGLQDTSPRPDDAARLESGAVEQDESQEHGRGFNWQAAALAVAFGLGAIYMAVRTVDSELQRLDFLTSDVSGSAQASSAGSLAGLLLFGVLTFFFGLAALIALLRALGLHSGDSALGMPQGSIRAFMALILIMLFFLMAVFLYLDVARTGNDQRFPSVTEDAYNRMLESGQVVAASSYEIPPPADSAAAPEVRWDVIVRTTRQSSQVAEDIARQLVTVLGTLIVAIAAFYFGANAVEAAQRPNKPVG